MFEKLNEETLEKVRQAKTREEALELLKQNGISLSDDDLANASGGNGDICQLCIFDGIPIPPCYSDDPPLPCPLYQRPPCPGDIFS